MNGTARPKLSVAIPWIRAAALVSAAGLGAVSCRPEPRPQSPATTDPSAPAQTAQEETDPSPCTAAELPEDVGSRRFRAVVELLGAPTRDAIIAFDRDTATEEMLLRWPLEEQVEILGSGLGQGTPITICRIVEQTEAQVVGVIGFDGPDSDAHLLWLEVDLDPTQEDRVVQFQTAAATEAALEIERPIGVPLVTRAIGGEPLVGDAEARRALVEANLMPSFRPNGKPAPRALSARMAELSVPGVSIAVIHEGRIDWAMGYGVRRAGEPGRVDANTMFQAASMSKPVSVLAALRLAEAGTIDLDTDVDQYLKTWSVPDNEHTKERPVTIRDIASHCAGFTVHGFAGYAEGAALPTAAQILDGEPPANSPPVRVDKRPGEGFRYSGGGTTVLQQLLIDVTGKPFPKVVSQQVLRPAGMRRSTFEQPLPKRFHANAAVGHRVDGRIVEGRWHTYPEMAAAGLWTRPSDLATFLIEVHRAYEGKRGSLVGQAMAEDALGRQCPGMMGVPGAVAGHVGLGFMVAPRTGDMRFGHGGANAGYRGEMVMDVRRGSGVVVMANSDTGGVLAAEVINAVAHVYGWPAHEHQEVALAPLDASAFDAIAGTYNAVPDARVPVKQISFSRDGDTLLASFGDQIVVEMYPAGGQSYLIFEAYIIRLEFGTSGDEMWVELDGAGGRARFVQQPGASADPRP